MQITELEGKFIYSKEGVQIDQGVTQEELKAEWTKIKFISDTAKDIEAKLRDFSIEKFGEDRTIEIEADIITELGFSIKAYDQEKKPASIPLPTHIIKAFQKVDESYWQRCKDQFSSVETVRLYVSALRPIAERYKEAQALLLSKESV